eukprot:745636-Hanusia_phi.AAC.1
MRVLRLVSSLLVLLFLSDVLRVFFLHRRFHSDQQRQVASIPDQRREGNRNFTQWRGTNRKLVTEVKTPVPSLNKTASTPRKQNPETIIKAPSPISPRKADMQIQRSKRLSQNEFLHAKRCKPHPSIDLSLRPYRLPICRGQVTKSVVRKKVREKQDFIGVSIQDNSVTYFGAEGTRWQKNGRVTNGLIQDIAKVAEEVDLPDVEFIAFFHDGFGGLHVPDSKNACVPVFVQEKRRFSDGILATPRSVTGFRDSFMSTAALDNMVPFEQKKNKAFFRGSTTGGIYSLNSWRSLPRSRIVQASLDHPDLLDARFTSVVQADSTDVARVMEKEGFVSRERVSHSEQWKYKMVVVPDGNSVPDRLLDFLASNVVVLKQESANEEFWYRDLEPFHHYIPFKHDASNLIAVIRSSLQNESLLRYVSQTSTLYVLENLNSDAIKCYLVQLLYAYAEVYTKV